MFSFEISFEEFIEGRNLRCQCKRMAPTCAEYVHAFHCPIGVAKEEWTANGRKLWDTIQKREHLELKKVKALSAAAAAMMRHNDYVGV